MKSPAPAITLADAGLPPPPERPDCCGGGCAVCVLDGYAEELQQWQQAVETMQRLRATQRKPDAPA